MAIRINGTETGAPADPRVSLLDLLRETLHLTGTKMGCNQGACHGAAVLAVARVFVHRSLSAEQRTCRAGSPWLGISLGRSNATANSQRKRLVLSPVRYAA